MLNAFNHLSGTLAHLFSATEKLAIATDNCADIAVVKSEGWTEIARVTNELRLAEQRKALHLAIE